MPLRGLRGPQRCNGGVVRRQLPSSGSLARATKEAWGARGEWTTLYRSAPWAPMHLQLLSPLLPHQHRQQQPDTPECDVAGSIKKDARSIASCHDVHDPCPSNTRAQALEVLDDSVYTLQEREEAIKAVLSAYTRKLRHRAKHHLGYPLNQDLDFKQLGPLMEFSINNLGDPFIESNYGVHSREFEVGVLNWFAKLWEIEEKDYWGYITTCGTEGNLHGIYVGRENLPDGILYASQDSHYSIFKAARMYRMDNIKVKSQETGIIDYDDLRLHLSQNKHRPAILNLNIGTTVKGAVDDLDKVLAILQETGYSEDRFYIHCDGALFGIMMSFLKDASALTFKKAIGSISVSGHKFIGTPTPSGIVMTRLKHAMALSSDVEYLNSRDATIMGSRNGQAPIQLWYTLTRKGYDGLRRDVEKCMDNAQLLRDMLQAAGFRAMLNDLSNTVVFERPKDEVFVRKWQLACEGDIAHAIVMPNHSATQLQSFVEDYVRSCSRMTIANNVVPGFGETLAPAQGFGETLAPAQGYMELEQLFSTAINQPSVLER